MPSQGSLAAFTQPNGIFFNIYISFSIQACAELLAGLNLSSRLQMPKISVSWTEQTEAEEMFVIG